jgi:hypothetical protein
MIDWGKVCWKALLDKGDRELMGKAMKREKAFGAPPAAAGSLETGRPGPSGFRKVLP